MGLQGHLSDVSSGSIPLMFVAILASFFRHVRTFLLGLCACGPHLDDSVSDCSALEQQLNLNRLFSYRNVDNAASDCIVCLSNLKAGEEVRNLECRHVFHKHCLEGWLQHLNFNCPLCRSPLPATHGPHSFPPHSAIASH